MSDRNLNQRVIYIKENKEEADKLIKEYRPFIATVVQSHVGRYVEYGIDDELSIGLMAFHEAIEKYDIAKGNFLSFARMTIKHRLIDHYRRETKNPVKLLSIEQGNPDDGIEEDLSVDESIKQYQERELATLRRLEIQEIQKELSQWGISFADVAKSSPKQQGTKKAYMDAVKLVATCPELLDTVKLKRYLPVDKIVKGLKIPRKTVERGRNYIVAAVLIISGDYDYLKDYIQWG